MKFFEFMFVPTILFIVTLETLLDSDYPDWRQNQERRQHYEGNTDRSH